MPTLTVRQLEDDASMVRGCAWWSKWVEATETLRGDELPIPARATPREIDLS